MHGYVGIYICMLMQRHACTNIPFPHIYTYTYTYMYVHICMLPIFYWIMKGQLQCWFYGVTVSRWDSNPVIRVQTSVEPKSLKKYFWNLKIFFTKINKRINTLLWPGRDLNTQPSELESDALPLRHQAIWTFGKFFHGLLKSNIFYQHLQVLFQGFIGKIEYFSISIYKFCSMLCENKAYLISYVFVCVCVCVCACVCLECPWIFFCYRNCPTPNQISKSENRQGIDSYLNISDYMKFDIFYL